MKTIINYKSEAYPYKGYNGCNCICGIEVINSFVIVTELEENPGTSITNASESLAKQICNEFSIDPNKLILIEHYPNSRAKYSLVILGWNEHLKMFDKSKTTWKHMEAKTIEMLRNNWLNEYDNAIKNCDKIMGRLDTIEE